MQLSEVLAALDALQPEARQEIIDQAMKSSDGRYMIPNPGPQTDAWFSEADETFYGGAAGGGKTALLCGMALEEYQPALILRRQATQIKGIEDEIARMLGSRAGYNSQSHVWRLPKGGKIELGGVPNEADKEKYQGRPHRLKGFDEITQFSESMYRYIIGWLRDADGARCRVLATGNPPTSAEGMWVIRYWAPWLDKSHPNPAKSGELRWFTTVDGEDMEVDGPGPHEINGEQVTARSRTFIQSKLEDNPDLMATGYSSTLEALPKELRDRMRHGLFNVQTEDAPGQVIPSKWIQLAMARWTDRPPEDVPMTAVACDVAQGGKDKTQIQSRHSWWYSRFDSHPGKDTPDGPTVAGLIIKQMRDRCRVVVDAGGGYGGDTLTQLAHADVDCYGFKGGSGSASTTREGMYGFKNLRSQVVWQFREQLDPEYGSQIALPPDPELEADLSAFRYEVRASGGGEEIVVLPKEEMKEMLGRSPDKGDTTVMLSASTLGGLKRPKAAQERRDEKARRLQSVTSNSAMKARLRGKR
ncbi:terminase [Rhizobium sp. Root708]|uniref:terminase family protein n=1 Tax=Rhizobium sp. Root708 TaxID=1736592 RepID=UPI0006F36A31|nr:terminase family protein [Rhizobium sp. Root708]KRB51794.1 terminase [Rhizobium sp. Root708]